MNTKSRPRIALLVEASRAYGRELLRGVALYARTQADWSLLHQEMTLDAEMPTWMKNSKIRGVIARVDTHTIHPLRKLHVPVVDVCCSRKFSGVPQVETDNQRVAQLAFDHLWERGFRRFAFCGFRFASYSGARQRHFRELVSRRQLERRFREELGRTPHEQITAAQIERVKQLLLESNMTLEQIAPKAGYMHKESLSAVFKRETGKTPGEYRRMTQLASRNGNQRLSG